MEKERLGRELEEKEMAERIKKLKEEFGDTENQWEQDKTEMQKLVKQDKKKPAAKARARGGGAGQRA